MRQEISKESMGNNKAGYAKFTKNLFGDDVKLMDDHVEFFMNKTRHYSLFEMWSDPSIGQPLPYAS
jgi:hypothetical protein